ncbi:MAG TPA: transglutaminase domain-containing protein [Puia sp.]|nr:transglutaminase domain-containing protein [Puia sp.]
MKKIFLLPAKFFLFQFSYSQIQLTNNFEQFAKQQDSIFIKLYEQRNTLAFEAQLKIFLTKYNSLDSANKKNYNGNLINAYYNLCCTYSLINNKNSSLHYFAKSIQSGYNNYYHILEDSDLNNIRNEKNFKELVQPLRETGDYLYILKKGSIYYTTEKRELPEFSYQSSDNPNLVTLRKELNLDSIAGTGNDISKMLSLMHWIHNLIPHDGNHENPIVKNALSMIAVCKKDNRGLNCRGLATVLNECYLSLGFKSRFVTCLPKDSLGIDNDCHVINMAYSSSLKKWIWIDPTFDAYVMNEKGELLSIEEVRERIIHDEPLIISPDANWNHKVSETKEYYLNYYMAKNLYKLECAASSEYDLETQTSGKKITYIELLPLDYFMQTPQKSESTNKNNNTTFISYKTNNPLMFWQTP